MGRLPGWLAAAAFCAALSATASAADHVLLPGQTATGRIGAAEEVDRIRFYAPAGAKITLAVTRAKGEGNVVQPRLLRLTSPSSAELLATAKVVVPKKGTSSTVSKLKLAEAGEYVLEVGAADGTTGDYTLTSSLSPAGPLLATPAGTIATGPSENPHGFTATAGSVVQVSIGPAKGSKLKGRIPRIERASDSAPVDLTGAKRTTRGATDRLTGVRLTETGGYRIVCAGDGTTTGAYAVALVPAKKPALDFTDDGSTDPDPDPDVFAAASVTPGTLSAPSTSATLDVTGGGFLDGATVALSPSAGVSNLTTQYVSKTKLVATFDLAEDAPSGTRSVVVTNVGGATSTLTGAVSVTQVPPAFRVDSVTPAAGPAAGGGKVLIRGRLFAAGAIVKFGTEYATHALRVDERTLVCTVPPAPARSRWSSSLVTVTVDNGGGSTATLAAGYAYDRDVVRPSLVNRVAGEFANTTRVVYVFDKPMNSTQSLATGALRCEWVYYYDSAGFSHAPYTTPTSTTQWTQQGTDPSGRALVLSPASGFFTETNDYWSREYLLRMTAARGYGQGSGYDWPQDAAGNQLFDWAYGDLRFRIDARIRGAQSGNDSWKPVVTSFAPGASEYFETDSEVSLTFDEPVDPTTVTASTVYLDDVTAGATVPCVRRISDDLRTVTLVPIRSLEPGHSFHRSYLAGLKDLFGNGIQAGAVAGSSRPGDSTAPDVFATVDEIPAELNGSGTWGSNNAFDLLVPRSGFTVDLTFSDRGGSGIDESSLVVTCSRAMGSAGAGTNLASFFRVDQLGARWQVDGAHALTVFNDVTFTATVKDRAGNTSSAATITVDVGDASATETGAAGTAATNVDPFDARDVWVIDVSPDAWTYSPVAATPRYWNISAGTDGKTDFDQDLEVVGLSGAESASGAASVVNGADTGTRAILRRRVLAAVRARLNERFFIAADGTRTADSVNVEFLLPGEQGSLPAVPSGTWTTASGWNVISLSGRSTSPPTTALESYYDQAAGYALDSWNRTRESLTNTGTSATTNRGVYGANLAAFCVSGYAPPDVMATVLKPLAWRLYGTPVGADPLDATVLAGSFSYASASAAAKARYDAIDHGVDVWSRYLASWASKVVALASGTYAASYPPYGFFSGQVLPTSGGGPVDDPGTSPYRLFSYGDWTSRSEDTLRPHTDDQMGFGPLERAYLRRRLLHR